MRESAASSLDALTDLADRHGCHLAIRNAADSGVVGGPRATLETLCREATGSGAQRAVVLPVHTPSHTPLLHAATAAFRDALAAVPPRRPPLRAPRLVSGLDGSTVFRDADGREKLALQISRTIDWAACLDACREYGADRVLELGPGPPSPRWPGPPSRRRAFTPSRNSARWAAWRTGSRDLSGAAQMPHNPCGWLSLGGASLVMCPSGSACLAQY